MIRAGDRIVFKAEWQDAGDELFRFFAAEDEDGGRVLVRIDLGFTIDPLTVVNVDMIAGHWTPVVDEAAAEAEQLITMHGWTSAIEASEWLEDDRSHGDEYVAGAARAISPMGPPAAPLHDYVAAVLRYQTAEGIPS